MDCPDCSCSNSEAVQTAPVSRSQGIKQAKRLAMITIVWNIFEGGSALVLGYMAGSVALTGFGLDSTIETASAAIVGWRLYFGELNCRFFGELFGKVWRIVWQSTPAILFHTKPCLN